MVLLVKEDTVLDFAHRHDTDIAWWRVCSEEHWRSAAMDISSSQEPKAADIKQTVVSDAGANHVSVAESTDPRVIPGVAA